MTQKEQEIRAEVEEKKAKRNYYTRTNLIILEMINGKRHLFTQGVNTRIPRILMMRSQGYTLEQIGNLFGITKERVRLQEAKGCEMLREEYIPQVLEPKIPKKLTQQKIGDNLSTRTTNALYNSHIITIGGLIRNSEYELLHKWGIGQKGLQEIKMYLNSVGLNLRENEKMH